MGRNIARDWLTLLQRVHSRLQSAKSFFERRAWAAEVQANVNFAVERNPIAQADAMAFEVSDGIFEFELGDIHPTQVSRFVLVETDIR